MARLLFQYMANYSFENLPNSIRNLPKCVRNFAKYLSYPLTFAEVVLIFCPSGEILPNLVTLIERPPLTTSPPSFAGLGSRKCDQMARWFVQFWPFTAMSIFPISLKELPKLIQNFANHCIIYFCQSDKISPNMVTLVSGGIRRIALF